MDSVIKELDREELDQVSGGSIAGQLGAAVVKGLAVLTGKGVLEGPCKTSEPAAPSPAPVPYPN